LNTLNILMVYHDINPRLPGKLSESRPGISLFQIEGSFLRDNLT
jgi:hypothetical protein